VRGGKEELQGSVSYFVAASAVVSSHVYSAIAATLQLVFFDGEEALKDWTATDSLCDTFLYSMDCLSLFFFFSKEQ
jgi:hypothetical protein